MLHHHLIAGVYAMTDVQVTEQQQPGGSFAAAVGLDPHAILAEGAGAGQQPQAVQYPAFSLGVKGGVLIPTGQHCIHCITLMSRITIDSSASSFDWASVSCKW